MRFNWMGGAFAFFIGLATLGLAEEKGVRRLETVNWDPVKRELTWTVSNGSKNAAGKYEAGQKSTYRIDMDGATMSVGGETRRFSKQEASSVTGLMQLIATYAVESTIWWEKGYGEKVTGGERVEYRAPSRDRCEAPTLVLASYQPR
ncbi:MAG: hypothetical protein SFV54_03530 [Bryobacteraceae bacterium]|nr:hypothetical protein [Bryobacteraceae bacterium]